MPPRPAAKSPNYAAWYQAMSHLRSFVTKTITLPPSRLHDHGYSSNWAGWQSGAQPFSSVQGEWNVPSVTRTDGNYRSSAQWVGVGAGTGAAGGNDQLVQPGTEVESFSNGYSDAYTWYEIYPDGPPVGIFWVNQGDTMYVSLYGQGSTLYPYVEDVSTGQAWNNNNMGVGFSGSCGCSQAEAIVEKDSQYLTWISNVNFSSVAATNSGGTQYLGNLPDDSSYVLANNACCWMEWPSPISGGSFTAYRGAWDS
ncbi:MAG TPA: G1 family glutamic endopeptidase [Streptosporangiaceae bacterium]|nr:G1 family glutamic endopeptidase [Streptosporangiaceae bacterium]